MRKRLLGRSGIEVSEICLGTWGLGGGGYGAVYHREVERVIDKAIESGVTIFDTADVYGDGKMETVLGERLDAAEHFVVTKIGTRLDADPPQKKFDEASLAESFDKSRERLKRDALDAVLLHNPSPASLESGEGVAFLKDKVKQKELRLWGVSCGSADVIEKAVAARADIIELPYNIFWQRDLHGLADQIAGTDVAVLARSVLMHGLLAGHWAKTKIFFESDHRSKRWTKEGLQYRIAQLEAIRHLVGGEVITMRAAALRFVLANAVVSSAVIGPRSVTQLNQLVHEAGEGPPYLDDELLMELPARLEAVGVEL